MKIIGVARGVSVRVGVRVIVISVIIRIDKMVVKGAVMRRTPFTRLVVIYLVIILVSRMNNKMI